MKDFDAARRERAAVDRDFTIGGEAFRARASVKPEKLAPYESLQESDSIETTLAIIDELILAFVEPTDDAHARYRAMREREDDAVSVADLQELVEWLMEINTGRPTERPGASTESPGPTGTTSTDDSSLQDTPEAVTA